jgi:cytochrome c553
MQAILLILALTLGLVACGNKSEETVTAPEPDSSATTTPEIIGDIEAGKKGSQLCASCHGNSGISEVAGTPHIAGQPQQYLLNALTAYKTNARKHEVMEAAVATLSEQDLLNLAGYYASLPAPDNTTNPEPPPAPAITEVSESEQNAAAPAAAATCLGCHGETGVSVIPGTPSLAGLGKGYLVAATQAYRDQTRKDPVMAGMVAALSDADIEAISAFFAAQPITTTANADSGDAAAGEVASAACAGCHGADGNSSSPDANPSLASQDASYLIKAMSDYKNGARDNAVMPGMVAALSDTDLANLAAFYAAKERAATVAEAASEPKHIPLSAEEWALKCNRCHGENGKDGLPQYPHLANQRADYIVSAMRAYQQGTRESQTMHRMIADLTEAELEAIGNYYSRR